jgi:hypothetical protein
MIAPLAGMRLDVDTEQPQLHDGLADAAVE